MYIYIKKVNKKELPSGLIKIFWSQNGDCYTVL